MALSIAGSAVLLLSCDGEQKVEPLDEETLISRVLDSMSVTTTQNGKKTNVFNTPKLEAYEFATVPFTEYRKGIEVIAYDDSTGMETMHVTSDYALHWTERDLWELKGNVVVVGDGRTLRSQQLMWDRKTHQIYSNVDSRVEQGEDIFLGEGFEAKDDFSRWTFRRIDGDARFNVEPTRPEPTVDSVSVSDVPPTAPAETNRSQL
jgi:LPS export ABC transporter protein LptC